LTDFAAIIMRLEQGMDFGAKLLLWTLGALASPLWLGYRMFKVMKP